jgi:hypothetical protein
MNLHNMVDKDGAFRCTKCKCTYEQYMNGLSCGLVRCKECTLLRVCYCGTCEECTANKIAAINALRPVEYEEDCETCGGTGEIDETLGGISTSNQHAPCPDCRFSNAVHFILSEAALEDTCARIHATNANIRSGRS